MPRADRPKFLILTGLAAILLVAQLVLAAGHFHYVHIAHANASASAGAASASAGVPASPADDHDDADCPLCWIQTAGASLLRPDPPGLPNRHVEAAAPVLPPEPQRHATSGLAAFRPRAPPAPACPIAS